MVIIAVIASITPHVPYVEQMLEVVYEDKEGGDSAHAVEPCCGVLWFCASRVRGSLEE